MMNEKGGSNLGVGGKWKARVLSFLKLMVSCVLIFVLLKQLKIHIMLQTIQRVKLDLIIFGIIVFGFTVPILAWRWMRVLKAFQMTIPFTRAIRINLIGVCSSNFFPGILGGDLVRPLYLLQDYPNQKTALYASVFFERICGLISILILGMIGSIWMMVFYQEWFYFAILGLTVILLSVALGLVFWMSQSKKSWPGIWGRVQRISQNLAEKFILFIKDRRLLVRTVAFSSLSQIIILAVYWLFLAGAGAISNPMKVIIAISLAWLIALIPVSFNGWGLREGSMVYLLTRFGIASDQAGAAALLGILPTLILSVIGAVFLSSGVNLLQRLKENARVKNES